MARRRLYVFGTIIVVGLLIGFFCLPGGGQQNVTTDGNGAEELALDPDESPRGLALAIEDKAAGRAKDLVGKARLETSLQVRYKLLREAYKADPRGKWGGQAAAEIGDIHERRNNTEQARRWYTSATSASLPAAAAARVRAKLATLAAASSSAGTPARIKFLIYKVKPGDSLWKIARRHATSIGAIRKANRLKRDLIRVGKVLRVPKGPFDALVTKSRHTLQLLQNGRPIKIYRVGLGRDNATPTGSFVVTSKLVNPVWYSDKYGRIPYGDPRNVLGSRWIGFNGRIGIHGTRKTEESTIGKNMSDGCVRMRDADVKELYGFLVQSKSKVTVVE